MVRITLLFIILSLYLSFPQLMYPFQQAQRHALHLLVAMGEHHLLLVLEGDVLSRALLVEFHALTDALQLYCLAVAQVRAVVHQSLTVRQ